MTAFHCLRERSKIIPLTRDDTPVYEQTEQVFVTSPDGGRDDAEAAVASDQHVTVHQHMVLQHQTLETLTRHLHAGVGLAVLVYVDNLPGDHEHFVTKTLIFCRF